MNEIITTVTREKVSELIRSAQRQIVYVTPGLPEQVTAALVDAFQVRKVDGSVILDPDPDVYYVGYGDLSEIRRVSKALENDASRLRKQPGLRFCLLLADDTVAIWSPEPRSAERERKESEPNGVILVGEPVSRIADAVSAPESQVAVTDCQVGNERLQNHEIQATVQKLEENPPISFDLSEHRRIFSTRYQYVETEIRGVKWTNRRLSLSSILINIDLSQELQEVLETSVKPFKSLTDAKFKVPAILNGEEAFTREGKPMVDDKNQEEILRGWEDTKNRYLRKMKGFGWLIKRSDYQRFEREARAYESVLKAWVKEFRKKAELEEDQLIEEIRQVIESRRRNAASEELKGVDIAAEVREGLKGISVTEPSIKIIPKDISWQSVKDEEFLAELRRVLPPEERKGWYEEYDAAKERKDKTLPNSSGFSPFG